MSTQCSDISNYDVLNKQGSHPLVSPSILAADFLNLGRDIEMLNNKLLSNIGFVPFIMAYPYGIKNETLKKILPSSILLNPIGKNGNEIWIEDFEQLYPLFFKSVLEIQKADISEFSGFGEFTEDGFIEEVVKFKDMEVE